MMIPIEGIAYEPHPVSPERKAELRAQGYRIIDARFAPAGYQEQAQDAESAPRIRRRRGDKE